MKTKVIFGLIIVILLMAGFLLISRISSPREQTSQPIIYQPSPTPLLPRDIPLPPNPEPGKELGGASDEYKREALEFIQKTPVLQKLPAASPFFAISYINEQHLIIKSKTDNKERDYQMAKAWLVQNDIDIGSIKLEYK